MDKEDAKNSRVRPCYHTGRVVDGKLEGIVADDRNDVKQRPNDSCGLHIVFTEPIFQRTGAEILF